ncbi:NAD(+) synthase [Clostridium oryzae]|uniref:Glutamine-dependent NAD(+) synthetase n=1 Tax=Clostridium oryzae TaxID=1450648 RepID=A0A1V4I678_9CLOT|nr:NAD(+) synthase [Clostridium oryzae]OPJ55488.1 glutamine-dependent NAD(+) synthetase [Clostridium oryzae]
MNFLKVATACPKIKVADTEYNLKQIEKCIDDALEKQCKYILFPELSITAYTCGDLFLQDRLIDESYKALEELCKYLKGKDILIAVGSPLVFKDSIYNCAFIIFDGKILGIVPKSYIPNYSEFYEKRWFAEGFNIKNELVNLPFQSQIPFGVELMFSSGKFKFAFDICEDLWVPIPPSSQAALSGANIISNLSASNELVSKADYRKNLVISQSAKTMSAYLYSSAGVHESSTDVVFSGHMLITENGSLLKENTRFQRENDLLITIIDINKLINERVKNSSFHGNKLNYGIKFNEIEFKYKDLNIRKFDRYIDKHPFVPSNEKLVEQRCKEIFNIQKAGLAKRITHTGLNKAVVGISGGLDSTLALLVIIKTFDMLKLPRKNIITVTMPGFGTTDRTYNNAVSLCKQLNTSFREVNIVDACIQHFKDIGHDAKIHDVTYENVQARERTQILMDIANKEGGLVIGTGDLSELALGWATYNGDHMSMYGVNCSVPKTLVRYLVNYVAQYEVEKTISEVLIDILNTPVSPELLPKDSEGNIAQKTEDIVGPYELHDFFLYYFIRQGASPEKIKYLAGIAFAGDYSEDEIDKWLKKFMFRFFSQQFKRSALPDGPKVGTISLSPRGDWRMPSDASPNSFTYEF